MNAVILKQANAVRRIRRAPIVAIAGALFCGCSPSPPAHLMRGANTFTPCPDSFNCVSSQAATNSRHYVAPLAYETTPAMARNALMNVLKARSNVRIAHASADFIHAVFTTPLGFTDDVTLVLQPNKRVIDIKSASRVGYYDFGKNARRVAGLRSDFRARLITRRSSRTAAHAYPVVSSR